MKALFEGSLVQKKALGRLANDALLLLARVFPGVVFWQSGQTKVDDLHLSDTAVFLFQEEYRLPWIDPTHGTWSVGLALLMLQGGGRTSLDSLAGSYCRPPSANISPCVEHADPEHCLGGPQ